MRDTSPVLGLRGSLRVIQYHLLSCHTPLIILSYYCISRPFFFGKGRFEGHEGHLRDTFSALGLPRSLRVIQCHLLSCHAPSIMPSHYYIPRPSFFGKGRFGGHEGHLRDTFPALGLRSSLHVIQCHLLYLPRPFNCVISLLHSKAFLFWKGTFEGHFSSPGAMGLPACDPISPAILPRPFNYITLLLHFKTFLFWKGTFRGT